MAVHQWRLEDPYDTDPATRTYVFPMNPNDMTSPFPARNISAEVTTAVTGQVLMFEGATAPTQWSFSGNTFTLEEYEALRSWVYDRRRRIWLFDHFGRRITCVLTRFDPKPKRSVGKYWRHTYEITALVIAVGNPTVSGIG